MKLKKYSTETVNEVYSQLKNNTAGGKCVDRLFEIYNEISIPVVKNAIIHDLSVFLNAWFKLVNDTKTVDPNVSRVFLNKVLSPEFIQSDNYIKNIQHACKKCGNSNRYVNVVISYVRACIKAIIMTKRRSLGFDIQGSRFIKNK